MPDIGDCDIGGMPCTIIKLGTGAARANSCCDCGYFGWAPDDIKFVVEHDSYREHLCPTCAVNRGLEEEYFHVNANDPRECPAKPEFDETKCSQRNCKSVSGLTNHTVGNFTTSSLLEAVNNKSGETVMLCPDCWIENAVIHARKEGGFDYFGGERPENVLEKVSDACKTIHTEPPEEKGGTAGKKRPLSDAAEDTSVSKKTER